MKLKLGALLVFSQAASAVTTIDKQNYIHHFCDENLFKPEQQMIGSPVVPLISYTQEDTHAIYYYHENFCCSRRDYDEAVKTKDSKTTGACLTQCGTKSVNPQCKDAWIEFTGVRLAQACEMAKGHKKNKKDAWNTVVPMLESCNNIRCLR